MPAAENVENLNSFSFVCEKSELEKTEGCERCFLSGIQERKGTQEDAPQS
jgi:hypothetical protein